MTQKRIQDYGSPADALSLKTLLKSVFPESGILYGNELVAVRNNAIQIKPGACKTAEGVIIIEDEYKEIPLPDLSVPGNYTIYYSHVDSMVSGGVPAILTIDSGFLQNVAGVILGYIQYDGILLVQSQIIQPYNLETEHVQNKIDSTWVLPIRNFGYMVTNNTGGAIINITDTWELVNNKYETFVKIKNNSNPLDVNRIGYVTFTFPFKVFERPYSLLQIIAGVSNGAFITLRFSDSVGNIITFEVPPSQIFKSSLLLKEISFVQTTTQNPNTIVYVHVDLQLGVGSEANIQAIGLSPYNIPA